ncbi:major facilitator superfamily domain-containing protein 6-like [Mytilus californianus]|uniref:major facilitator superfamily domain-containing protein 6-like n=1 Tax=Mytilus californianus TaxID=6549 RepID=UPI0022467A62|nr:major facilitator superfamily domain-containing protein 6-like [Mytilus californianus]
MALEFDSDESDAEERSPSRESRKYKVHSLDSGYNKQKPKRDLIDTLFTYVNRDLLICKLFYFFFFAAFGSLFPLLAIYFKQLAMNPTQSGLLMGFRPFIEFCSAPFWGSLADRYRKAKELLLFSLLCWIVFTLAIAFVKPPHDHCLTGNATHEIPPGYVLRYKRALNQGPSYKVIPSSTTIQPVDIVGILQRKTTIHPHIHTVAHHVYKGIHNVLQNSNKTSEMKGSTHHPIIVQIHKGMHKLLNMSTTKPTQSLETTTINRKSDDSIKPMFSSIYYDRKDVQDTFFTLLLLIVIGEFFSAPAITFVDSVTLEYLGEDIDNYGRQRMFGSLGWGLAMFFVGLALDHSSTFPDHPCGIKHIAEKNYTICFAVFSVLMSCALITATQLQFRHHQGGRDIQLIEIVVRVKDRVMEKITGEKRPHSGLLFDDADSDINYLESKAAVQKQASEQQEGIDCQITLDKRPDMVTDAVSQPTEDAVEEPFLGKWIAVIKMLATFKYISVLFVSWFMGFGIGLIFTFLFWHLQDIGGSPTLFGVASILNHVSELLAFFFSRKIISSFGHIRVLYAGLLGNVARFIYISLLKNPWWVLPFELIQGVTHAAVWAACCSYITHAIPSELRSSAQGILQGLHHGLGRGCGAVFGGIMVYSYGTVVTFRAYGITCLIILIFYVGLNRFFGNRSHFSYGSSMKHERLEEESPTLHLAPHGVPSGMARDLSSSRLKDEGNPTYGSTYDDGENVNTDLYETGTNRIYMDGPPGLDTQIYQQQPYNTNDHMYGP